MCFILFGFAPVRAWERPINTYLVELTDVNRSPAIQSFPDVFKDGADAPLRTRKAKPWIMPPDLDEITRSASVAFQSARTLLAKQDPAAAAFQLGRAAYYLQALSDPIRGLNPLQYSTYTEEIQRKAEHQIVKLVGEQGANKHRSTYWRFLDKMNRKLSEADWPALLQTARSIGVEKASALLKLASDAARSDKPVETQLQQTFAVIVACQNRMLALSQLNADNRTSAARNTQAAPVVGLERRVRLEIWDASCEDGDQIDLVINGVIRLKSYTLTKKKHILDISLPRGHNQLEIRAVNSGSDCPAKAKPKTHASVALRITGNGRNFYQTWLLREGEKVRHEIIIGP